MITSTGIAWNLPLKKGISSDIDKLRKSYQTGLYVESLDRQWSWYYSILWSLNSRRLSFMDWGGSKVTDEGIKGFCAIDKKYAESMKGTVAEMYQDLKSIVPFTPMGIVFRMIHEEEFQENTVTYIHANGELRFTEGMVFEKDYHPRHYSLHDLDSKLHWQIGEIHAHLVQTEQRSDDSTWLQRLPCFLTRRLKSK